jgi:hypothetical protein
VRNCRTISALCDSPAARLPAGRATHLDLEKRVEALVGELDEALEQQMATSEVLRVISSSPGELDLVFQTMLANAIRICDANFGALFRFEDGVAAAAAMLGSGICRILATRPLPARLANCARSRHADSANGSHCRCHSGPGLP